MKKLVLGIISLFIFHIASAQCPEPPKILMGPDINVCDGGSVQLDAMLEGNTSVVKWIGGKGEFVGRNQLPGEYTPAPLEVGTTIEFKLVAMSPDKTCKNDTATVHVTVNHQPEASAGPKIRICAGEPAVMKPVIKGPYSKITWSSTGTGVFNDPNLPEALYIPSLKDVGMGAVTMEMLLEPQGVCLSVTDATPLSIEQPPVVILDSIMKLTSGVPLPLKAKSDGVKESYFWSSSGTGRFTFPDQLQTEYEPTEEDIANPSLVLELTVVSASKTCVVKKQVTK